MPNTVTTDSTTQTSTKDKSIFVYMSSHKFWEGLYEKVDVGFVINMFKYQLADYSTVLMTTIVPRQISKSKFNELIIKEEKLKDALLPYQVEIEFLHIQGRTLSGVFNSSKEIYSRIKRFKQKFIWAKNYFNCFIGVLVKKRLPKSFLHFEMSGLVPEEELYYSTSNFFSRITRFLVLRLLEKIDLAKSNSISVVSKRFKEYIVKQYHIDSQKIEVLPCYFDHNHFFIDQILREEYRQKYQIADNQKIILYSGMLQKWQQPDLLFLFLRNIQKQDFEQEFRLMLLTFDQEKALQYVEKYGLKDVIITAASGEELNGLYNAADFGLAFRSADMVSFVSSPVKIPEYLATGNSLIMLEYIGDYGLDLLDKKYALVKKNETDLLQTTIEEINRLETPDAPELEVIQERYSILSNLPVVERILDKQNE